MQNAGMRLGALLRERRTEKGMSLREFSEYLSISHAYLNKLEKGYDPRSGRPVAPTIEMLNKISEGLGVDLSGFLRECGYGEASDSTLELRALAAEFVNTVMDAGEITLDGHPLSGDKAQMLSMAVDTLVSYSNFTPLTEKPI